MDEWETYGLISIIIYFKIFRDFTYKKIKLSILNFMYTCMHACPCAHECFLFTDLYGQSPVMSGVSFFLLPYVMSAVCVDTLALPISIIQGIGNIKIKGSG